jgi:hypothetical protein
VPYHLCQNCGTVATEVTPCPCELGGECPNTGGVCPRCWAVISSNAITRRLEHRAVA